LDLLTGLHFGHPPEPALPEQSTTSARHDQLYSMAESLEGGQVEVVEVQVRHKNRVDVGNLRRGDSLPTTKVRDAGAQDRVG
jgi:hypothetical protein